MTILNVLLYFFIVVVIIQIIYYLLFFAKFPFIKSESRTNKYYPVSVIICAKNEARNLKSFLPSILSQDYPKFEIVLINDASHDETLEVIQAFSKQHDNIKIVDVKNNEAFWANKKYALTLGIKASTYNHLLFTDADCKPVSNQWIRIMFRQFSKEKKIVLGYGAYTKIKKSFLNKLIRFETVLTAIQYFSFAKIGLPYMGVGRNLAYTKDMFFKTNGFMNHMKIRSGDDDLFVNQIANKTNTALCLNDKSFTESIPKTNFKNWFKQKRRHVSTAKHYKPIHKVLLALFYTSQLLFWLLAILLIVFQYKPILIISLVVFRVIMQYLIMGFSAKKLNEKDLIAFLPFLEIFLIISQFIIFINNLISKPNHWK